MGLRLPWNSDVLQRDRKSVTVWNTQLRTKFFTRLRQINLSTCAPELRLASGHPLHARKFSSTKDDVDVRTRTLKKHPHTKTFGKIHFIRVVSCLKYNIRRSGCSVRPLCTSPDQPLSLTQDITQEYFIQNLLPNLVSSSLIFV